MNQNIKLGLIITVIVITSFTYKAMKPKRKVIDLKKEIIYNDPEGSEAINGKIDINTSSLEDYIKIGITSNLAVKIIDYVDTVGVVEDLNEIKRIDGIGEKTAEKLVKKLEIKPTKKKKKKLNINKSTLKELKYYGFTKKEIKAIEKYKKENNVIYSNIDMIAVLGEKRHQEYENILKY